MESTMYNQLLMSPLFTGLTTGELTEILAHIHLDFNTYERNDVIVLQDDRCDRLTYVLRGKVKAEMIDPRHRFVLIEVFDKPFLIEAYNMYGMKQAYEHTYVTVEKTNTVSMTKQEFHSILMNYRIPRINAMNLLCAQIHRMQKMMRECEAETVERKIVQFLRHNALSCKGEKELKMKMEDLADYIKETRLNVSMALRRWNEAGLVEQQRGVIVIKDLGMLEK